jgi:ribose transport system permease protein
MLVVPRLSFLRDYAIVVSIAGLFIVLSIASPPFLTVPNLENVLSQTVALGIIACAETIVFIAGGFDLSVGAVFGISGVIAAKISLEQGPEMGITAGLLAGVFFGFVNGILVTVGRIHSFMATIGTNFVIAGIAIVITGGLLIPVTDPAFLTLGRGILFGTEYSVWVWAMFAVVLTLLLTRTTFGRQIYASGGNPEAARLSGIRVGMVRTAAFTLCGFSAALGGVILASRVGTGQADVGRGIELTVIAGIVIGGTSIFGGEGAIWRSVLGILFLTLIGNGFDLVGIEPTYQRIVQGTMILLAVGLDAWSRRST